VTSCSLSSISDARQQSISCSSADIYNNNSVLSVTDNDTSGALSNDMDQHTAAEVGDSTDTASIFSSSSQHIALQEVDSMLPFADAANAASSSSVSDTMNTGSPFRFSVAGYDFQKYKDMVTVCVYL